MTKGEVGSGVGSWNTTIRGPTTIPAVIAGRDGLIHVVYSYFVADGKSMKHAEFNRAWIQTTLAGYRHEMPRMLSLDRHEDLLKRPMRAAGTTEPRTAGFAERRWWARPRVAERSRSRRGGISACPRRTRCVRRRADLAKDRSKVLQRGKQLRLSRKRLRGASRNDEV